MIKHRTIDDYILEHPCEVCHAAVGEPCTIHDVVNPVAADESPQKFIYHVKRTDAGVYHFNVDNSALDDEERNRWHARKC